MYVILFEFRMYWRIKMFRRAKVAMTVLLLIMGMSVYGQQEAPNISLSLKDCIVKAMENNLGLAVNVLTPQLRDISVSQAKEKYLPVFSFGFNINDQQQASYSFLDAADVLTTSFNEYSADLSQEIPGGGNFSLRLNTSRYDTNRTGTTINPSYRAQLRFNYTQPLLKNFGMMASKRDIIIAQTNLTISEKDLKRSLQNTVYSVEQAYWNLVFSIENLKVSQQSLKLAQDLLEKNRRGVEVGTLAPIEIITAEAQVAQREADILAAEAEVRNNEDRLKQVINLTADTENADFLQITPMDEPSLEKLDISLDQALTTALQNRPDLDSTRLGIQNYEINMSYAKNQLLPGLNLNASYWSPGVSGDRLIYDPGDPWGGPIGSIPGGREDAFKDVFGFRYKNWAVGLTLDFPLNTIVSRAAYAQARVDLEQAHLRLKEQEQQIYTDLKIAVRAVETNFKRIQALKVARELAQRQLEAEEEKLKVGLSTNYFVLQYQRDLATARSQEIRAIIDYILSVAVLNRDMGVSLDEQNIQISGLWNK
jgi:outer membrane protein TolC